MNTDNTAKTWAHALRVYGFAETDLQESDCYNTLRKARLKIEDADILEVLKEAKELTIYPTRPGAWLYKRLSMLPMKEVKKPEQSFDIEEEMKDDDASHAYYSSQEGFRFFEPMFDRADEFLKQYKGAYWENTFISLYREAKERGTSIRQLCRERRIDYMKVIIGQGGNLDG